MSEQNDDRKSIETSIANEVQSALKALNLKDVFLDSFDVYLTIRENYTFDKPLYVHISSQELKKPFSEF